MTAKVPLGGHENEGSAADPSPDDELNAAYDRLDELLARQHAEGTSLALEIAIEEATAALRESLVCAMLDELMKLPRRARQ